MTMIEKLRAVKDMDEMYRNQLLEDAAEEIWCLREIVRDVRIMANAGAFKQFEGESWLKRVRNINLER